ncbi:MAG TPA: hypothetical protein VMV10_22895 [Pirellulales bacterium]|nr:hypothetical protein [Pirellulales bacterium]
MMRLLLCVAGICALVAVGCAKTGASGRQPVSGKVTLKGAPLDNGSIQFMPSDARGQFGGGAVITNGEYSIPQSKGMPIGKYKVVISAGDASQVPPLAEGEMPGESGPPLEERIPPEFNVNSEQFVDVTADKENVFNFDIP